MQSRLVLFLAPLLLAGWTSAQTWPQGDRLEAADGQALDNFGVSVAIDGTSAIVGAFSHDEPVAGAGAAYVFEHIDGFWSQVAELTAPDAEVGDSFGWSVAIRDGIVIVGAPNANPAGDNSGAAYIYERLNGSWQITATLAASDGEPFETLGYAVGIDGRSAIVGARFDDDRGDRSGSAYIFTDDGTGWRQAAKLIGSDTTTGDWFGGSVAMSAETAIVGAMGDDDNGSYTGAAYIFERTDGIWAETAKLLAENGEPIDEFGIGIALDGDIAVIGTLSGDIGSRGAAYIFERTQDTWIQTARIIADDTLVNDRFGAAVSVRGETVIVGAPLDDDDGNASGSAYIFSSSESGWEQTAKLTAPDAGADHQAGWSVGTDGESAIIGAWHEDHAGLQTGAAYIFARPCPADTDGDGDVDADDFFAYLDLFASGDSSADIDRDGDIDAKDFFAYLDLFVAGCS